MGFQVSKNGMDSVFKKLSEDYYIFAPKVFTDGGVFSDTDCIRYGEVSSIEEVVFDKMSNYSSKEVLLPVSQTLFYFTEDTVKEADIDPKGAIVFLRSCDLHGVKRLDEIYLNNGCGDYYYNKLREKVKFVLIGCKESFENCFCVSMETNKSENYSFSIDYIDGNYFIDCKETDWEELISQNSIESLDVSPRYVTSNDVKVKVPETLSMDVAKSKMWDEYDSRCIDCGRCNFVCPTCTCFTMQDILYSENGKAGERRRVWASCMVDGYTDVAGGESYRKKNGQRMRFKVLHKVLDYKQRFGYHMCVGCGRCDDICPEYISFSNCINKLEKAMEEVQDDE